MKHVIAILVTLILGFLHLIPAFMMYHLPPDTPTMWGIMYMLLGGLDICWGIVIANSYFSKR